MMHKMRTTLTLEPDVALRLNQLGKSRNISFKALVNETLRQGLDMGKATGKPKPFSIEPFDSKILPGIDPRKLNALSDDLEIEGF